MTEQDDTQAEVGQADIERGPNGAMGTPPYPAYKTLTNYLGEMKESVIPNRIDAGAMPTKSGADQSAIRTAMRFLGLTDEDDRPQAGLRALCNAHGTDQWTDVVRRYVVAAYDPIVEGLDLSTATTPQLIERFRTMTSASTSTISKAIRFYLAALKDADIEYSPYIKPPKANRVKRKKKDDDNGSNSVDPSGAEFEGGDGMKIHSFNIPGRKKPVRLIAYDDISAAEWTMVGAFMDAYIKLSEQDVGDDDDDDE